MRFRNGYLKPCLCSTEILSLVFLNILIYYIRLRIHNFFIFRGFYYFLTTEDGANVREWMSHNVGVLLWCWGIWTSFHHTSFFLTKFSQKRIRCLSRSVKSRSYIDAFGDVLFTFKFQLLSFVSQGGVVLYQPAIEFLPMIDKVWTKSI